MELKIENVSKTYRNGVKALKNVSLTIPNGMFGLLGQNGAGKSTLMRSVATLQDIDTGSICLDNYNVATEPGEVRKRLGYLPQEFGVYDNVSAEEMLLYTADLKGISDKKERYKLVHNLLSRVNLSEAGRKKLGTFSGGMRQRFGIAQALIGEPDLIIVDEPTAGLDPAERKRFYNLLSELGENSIVIFSTHIVEDVTALCNDVAIIGDGEVLTRGTPQQIIDSVRGRIWEKEIPKKDLIYYQDRFTVLTSNIKLGRMKIEVFSEVRPDNSFSLKNNDLEDAYFAAINPGIDLKKVS